MTEKTSQLGARLRGLRKQLEYHQRCEASAQANADEAMINLNAHEVRIRDITNEISRLEKANA